MPRKPPLGAFVAEALDPTFEETPFTPGQTGERWRGTADTTQAAWPSGPGHVIWCASYDKVRQTHPGLPQVHDPEDEPGWCVDFIVELDADGRLVRADLETDSLSETFAKLGMEHESQVAAGLMGQDAQAACHVLPDLISTLLARASG